MFSPIRGPPPAIARDKRREISLAILPDMYQRTSHFEDRIVSWYVLRGARASTVGNSETRRTVRGIPAFLRTMRQPRRFIAVAKDSPRTLLLGRPRPLDLRNLRYHFKQKELDH